MFGLKGIKKNSSVCSVCGRNIEPDTQTQISNLCKDCFGRCAYLSRQLEFLQNTSVENLAILQGAQNIDASIPSGNVTETLRTEIKVSQIEEEATKADSFYIVRKSNNEKIPVTSAITIGSSEQKATIALPENKTLSRVHAQIKINDEGKCCLVDLGSRNGSKINGTKIEPNVEYPLEAGNVFSLASEIFSFVVE